MAQTKPFAGQPEQSVSHGSEGERLEKELWADMKAFNIKSLEHKIAPEFQSIHLDGPRNRVGELELIKNLHLGNYNISNFKSSQLGDTIVVTYTLSVDETIDERRLSRKPSPRMSVWKKKGNEWQWIAHANLISLGAAH